MSIKYIALFDQKPNGFLCRLCKQFSLSVKEITTHFETDHSTESRTLAYLYSKTDLGLTGDNTESSDAGKYICEICLTHFSTFKGMKQHMGKMHLNKDKQTKCRICSKRFKHKYALKFHIRQVHECSTKVTCPTCFKLVYNKYSLKKHQTSCK